MTAKQIGTYPSHWIAPFILATLTIYFWEPWQVLNIWFVFILTLNLMVIAALLWWADGYEHEPWGTVAWSISWGAFPAILISLTLSSVSTNLFVAAIIEEFSKLLGLYIVWRRGSINSATDAFVIASYIGAGFTIFEDFAYAASSSAPENTLIARAVFSLFAHSLFSGVGAALMYLLWKKIGFSGIPVGFIFSYLIHYIWNWLVEVELFSALPLVGFIIFGVYPPLAMTLLSIWLRRRESHIIKSEGQIYVLSGELKVQVLEEILNRKVRRLTLNEFNTKEERKGYKQSLGEVVRFLVHRK